MDFTRTQQHVTKPPSGRKITVNEIVEALQANQSNVSKHLGLLYDGGLAGRRRDGNSIYYFIADPVVAQLCDLVS